MPGIFGWGSLPGAAPPCSSAPETSGSVSRPPAPAKIPYRGEFSTFCGSCCGKRKWLSGMPPIKAEQKNPRHSRASAGDFSMGQFARCCASLQQCAGRERVGQARSADPSAVGWHCEGESRASKKPQRTDFSTLCGPPGGKQRAPRGQKKPAVPVEQPVLNRQTQALWLAASMASIIAARTPASSMARMPRMVVPPGEQTLSLSAPGCRPLSSSILPAPITVWAASS